MTVLGVILTVILMLEVMEASVYSGREDICSLEECECQLDTVICTCSQDSSFQVTSSCHYKRQLEPDKT